MPRKANSPLPQPIFNEPVFSEGVPTPDPTQFKVPEPSDAALYKQIQNLLTKDTVSFNAARGNPAISILCKLPGVRTARRSSREFKVRSRLFFTW